MDPRRRSLCGASPRDGTAVELGLDRLARIDRPELAGLARAAAAGHPLHPAATRGRRGAAAATPASGAARPVDAATVAALPVPARKALAANPGLPSAARAAVVASARQGPSIRSELNGAAPADWAEAMASVPPAQRAHWAALVDGLGVGRSRRRLGRSRPYGWAGTRPGAEPVPVARLRARRDCASSGGPRCSSSSCCSTAGRRPQPRSRSAVSSTPCWPWAWSAMRALSPPVPAGRWACELDTRRLPRDDGGRARCGAPHA